MPDDFPLTEQMIGYAASKGVDESGAEAVREMVVQWARANEPLKSDWYAVYQTFLRTALKRGDIRPSLPVAEIPDNPPSRPQEALTPAEQTYAEFLRVVGAEMAPEEASDQTAAVVAQFGGWGTFDERGPPDWRAWVGAFRQSREVSVV